MTDSTSSPPSVPPSPLEPGALHWLRGQAQIVLVLNAGGPDGGFMEVAPAYAGEPAQLRDRATHRDLLLEPAAVAWGPDIDATRALLVAPWLAAAIDASHLGRPVGGIGADALAAARARSTESGDAEGTGYERWRGPRPAGPDDPRTLRAQSMAERWDRIREGLREPAAPGVFAPGGASDTAAPTAAAPTAADATFAERSRRATNDLWAGVGIGVVGLITGVLALPGALGALWFFNRARKQADTSGGRAAQWLFRGCIGLLVLGLVAFGACLIALSNTHF